MDLTGKVFGQLRVIRKTNKVVSREHQYECLCVCGKTTFVRGSDLKSSHTKSCGHLKVNHNVAAFEKQIVDGVREDLLTKNEPNRNGSTGYRGVTEYRKGKFRARLNYKNKTYSKGGFDSAKDAHEFFLKMKSEIKKL